MPGSSGQLSTKEKIVSVALSILIGVFTVKAAGLVAFYVISAAMKAKKLNHPQLQPRSPIIPPISKQKNKAVHFGEARARVFDHHKPAAEIGELDSATFNSSLSRGFTDFQSLS